MTDIPKEPSLDNWLGDLWTTADAYRIQLSRFRLSNWQELYEANVRLAMQARDDGHENEITPAHLAEGLRQTEIIWIGLHPPEIIPPTICAGCRQSLGAGLVITLDHGPGRYQIHADRHGFCLGGFHQQRHLKAHRALIDLGLKPPKLAALNRRRDRRRRNPAPLFSVSAVPPSAIRFRS